MNLEVITEYQPERLLEAPVLVLSPHLDDEILGCSHLLSAYSRKDRVHVGYCTKGNLLPAGVKAADNKTLLEQIGDIRKKESLAALECIGLDSSLTSFLDLPELEVDRNFDRLETWVNGLLDSVEPEVVLIPFRYDQHPDHLALNRAVRKTVKKREKRIRVLEYFIYSNYPLLPGKDIRKYCNADLLRRVKPDAEMKRKALQCFESQATNYFAGQIRPVLSEGFIEQQSRKPELFLEAADSERVLTIPAIIPKVLQAIQPKLKRVKEFLRTRAGAV